MTVFRIFGGFRAYSMVIDRRWDMRKKRWAIILALACFCSFIPMISSCKKVEQAHSRYEINAEYMPKSSTLTGTVKVTFENVIDNEISLLKFQLYPNAYRENAL